MLLKLCIAVPSDAPRIAEIHLAAFGSNALLRAQFPTPAIRAALQISVEQKALADIKDSKTSVLVVREVCLENGASSPDLKKKMGREEQEVGEGRVISFAKWGHPIPEGEHYTEPAWVWPEGTDLKLLEEWSKKVDAAYKTVLGRTPCYRLSFIGTDPLYERRGAGSILVQWGIEQCKKNNSPAYLESTIEAGPLYMKNGFIATDTLSIVLEGISEEGELNIYQEICFLFRP